MDPLFRYSAGWMGSLQTNNLGGCGIFQHLEPVCGAPERFGDDFEEISFMVEMHEKYRASRGGKETI